MQNAQNHIIYDLKTIKNHTCIAFFGKIALTNESGAVELLQKTGLRPQISIMRNKNINIHRKTSFGEQAGSLAGRLFFVGNETFV